MSLTHEDVRQLLELLDASQFDELSLEMGDLKLTLRRGAAPVEARAPSAAREETTVASAPSAPPRPAGLPEIRAPLLGTFHRAPKPGAEPFVQVGTRVEADSVVGIIEVMKLMNSVAAGRSGEIAEIVVRDGQFVEYGQVLMRLRPA